MEDVFRVNNLPSKLLQQERERALTLLTQLVSKMFVFEVGSTAVDGILGKQDLDFLVRVPKEHFASTPLLLDENFARNPQQFSSEIYQGYIVDSELDVAIQLTIEGGPQDTFLDFLNLLRSNPELRDQYNQLKKIYDGKPMDIYRDAKRAFIEDALRALNSRDYK